MRCDGSMSSASWLDGRQVPILLHHEKGGEKFLPKCDHFHVNRSMSGHQVLGDRGMMLVVLLDPRREDHSVVDLAKSGEVLRLVGRFLDPRQEMFLQKGLET